MANPIFEDLSKHQKGGRGPLVLPLLGKSREQAGIPVTLVEEAETQSSLGGCLPLLPESLGPSNF